MTAGWGQHVRLGNDNAERLDWCRRVSPRSGESSVAHPGGYFARPHMRDGLANVCKMFEQASVLSVAAGALLGHRRSCVNNRV